MRCGSCHHDNPDAARFCAQCGAALRAAGTEAPATAEEGERRQVTIVFSDLSGYTALNERVDPEEVEEVMGRIRDASTRIIDRHGGIVNQFVGDEVVALFGLPVARRDDARRAVAASLELHEAVRKIGAEVAPRIGRPLTMHTGINTGTIVTRRSDTRHGQYALTGDAVNTGARLLSLATEDEIVVGQDTWRQVSEHFAAEAGAPIEVKGKERPLVPWRIRGALDAESSARPLAGRAAEKERIEALARSCVDAGRGHVLIVAGDPGIGKSRLLQEAVACARRHGFATHGAAVLDFAERGRDAIGTLARSLLGLAPDADADERRGTLREAIDARHIAAEHEAFLYDLLDVEPPAALRGILAALDEPARSRGTLAAFGALAQRAASRGPVLVVVEDVHGADAWTLERLRALAALTTSQPLLLALSTRPEGDPTAGAWGATLPAMARLELGPLSADDALAMAASFAPRASDIARSYVERAEGNPLFLEQLLLNAEETAQTGVPGSIQGLVLARLDRLPAADRRAIQAAAVLGPRFAPAALCHLLGNEAYDVTPLVDHQLLRRNGADYQFCHALIRDGAYESVLKSRRRELHARAGEWYASRDLVLAAGHYERAGHAAAPRAYLAAAEAEAMRYHYGIALTLAERGLGLAAAREDRFALASLRAQVLHDIGRPQQSIAAWREALGAADGPVERCRALIGLASSMRIVDQVNDGLRYLDEAEPLAREVPQPLELSRLHHLRGNLYFGLGRLEDCLHQHEAALQSARSARSPEAEALALGGLADAHYLAGRMRSAHERFRRCVELCRAHGLARLEVANLHMAGWSGFYLHPVKHAFEAATQCVELAGRVSHHRAEMLSRTVLGYLQGWLMGDTAPALEQLDAALALARTLGAKRFEGEILAFQALADFRAGDRDRAVARARAGLDACRQHARHFFAPAACGVLARVARDPAEIEAAYAEGEALLTERCVSHNYLEFYTLAAEQALERGDWERVERYCDALERYTAQEPLPLCNLYIGRARALARHRRGENGMAAELAAHRREAARLGVTLLLK